MDLFKEFEQKFKSIDAKLISCKESIKNSSRAQIDKIEAISLANLETQHKIGLIESRELILNQAKKARNKQIEKINDYAERRGPKRVQFCFDYLIEEIKSVSANNLAFAESNISICQRILFSTRLEKNLSLPKLAKYSEFFTKTTLNMQAITDKLQIESYARLHKLSADLYCMYGQSTNEEYKHLIIFNRDGHLVEEKTLNFDAYDIRVNKTNIICFEYKFGIVKIYNFSLELAASFEFDENRFTDLRVNSYELGFLNAETLLFTCFDFKSKSTRLAEHPLHIGKSLLSEREINAALVDFNDEFVFVEKSKLFSSTLLVLHRDSYRVLFKFGGTTSIWFWLIEDMEVCGTEYNANEGVVFSLTMDRRGRVGEGVELKKGDFFDFYFVSKHAFVAEVPVMGKRRIQFYEY